MSGLVADASVIVAALVQKDRDGAWAEKALSHARLSAPHVVMVEVANVLRRLALAGAISDDVASLAHEDLLAMPIDLVPYEVVGARVWSLRANVRLYDAWYVAVAELVRAPLATLDRRLSRASGIRCKLKLPPAARAR